jgi:hypothetical protein
MTIEAFYLPRDGSGNVIIFDYGIDSHAEGKDDYYKMANRFLDDVAKFGKEIDFPDELVRQLKPYQVSNLLVDTEFFLVKTFFILVDQDDQYLNIETGRRYFLCGSNGYTLVFKSVNGFKIDVVEAKLASTLFRKKLLTDADSSDKLFQSVRIRS